MNDFRNLLLKRYTIRCYVPNSVFNIGGTIITRKQTVRKEDSSVELDIESNCNVLLANRYN